MWAGHNTTPEGLCTTREAGVRGFLGAFTGKQISLLKREYSEEGGDHQGWEAEQHCAQDLDSFYNIYCVNWLKNRNNHLCWKFGNYRISV